MAGDESERGWFWPQVKTLLGRTFKVFRRSTGWPFADDHIDANVGVEESYGVGVELTSPGKDNPIDCRWSEDGVTIVERGGVSHFVPKAVFIGGR